jgi:hypothetical protein
MIGRTLLCAVCAVDKLAEMSANATLGGTGGNAANFSDGS